jgi:hypothetical protein
VGELFVKIELQEVALGEGNGRWKKKGSEVGGYSALEFHLPSAPPDL